MQQQSITAAFGTIVDGVDIAGLKPAGMRKLYKLWQQRHLLVLRAQRPDRAAFQDFAAAFGETETMAPPEDTDTGWDAELSWVERPPFACVVRSTGTRALPGATWFACLPAALRLMAPDLAARLRWLALQHGPNVHPMLVMQPETGEHSLYLGSRSAARMPGLPAEESERLLNIVWSYATAASVTLCHSWQPGDVVLWNNLTVARRHDLAPAGGGHLDGLRVKGRYTLSAPIQQEAA